MNNIVECLIKNPVIAAIRDEEGLKNALSSQVKVVFILNSDILKLSSQVKRIKEKNKLAFIHFDLVSGLARDEKAVEYLKGEICPDGIISTRNNIIKFAHDNNIFTIQRFFLIDSHSFKTAVSSAKTARPDMIEILPGLMHQVTLKFTSQVKIPVIAGGLISSKKDIYSVLKAGAVAASTGRKEFWDI